MRPAGCGREVGLRVIGLETSGRGASVCLLDGDSCVSRDLSETGRRHARTLVPELKAMLDAAGVSARDCDAVALSAGPGSFTGLRVGAACAKTLAWAAGLKAVAVPTLAAAAEQSGEADCVVLANAERGQLFVAERRGGVLGETQIEDEAAALARLPDDAILTGPVPAKVRARHARRRWLSEEAGRPQAETVARLALRRLERGESDDPYTLLPDYGRLSAAEEKRVADASRSKT